MDARVTAPIAPARVIWADPPWKFNNRHVTRRDNPYDVSRFGPGADEAYKRRTGRDDMGCQTTEWICALGPLVQAIAAPDCLLFMWWVDSMPDDVEAVVEAWGFKRVKLGLWERLTKHGKQDYGRGRYMPTDAEPYWLCRNQHKDRGLLWHSNRGYKMRMSIHATKPERHSKKPEIFYEETEKWLGPHIGEHSMVELFATRRREGWHCFGYEATGRDIRDDLRDFAMRLELESFAI